MKKYIKKTFILALSLILAFQTSGLYLFLFPNRAFAQVEERISSKIIRESQRTNPLFVIQNISPKQFSDMVSEDISELLGGIDFKRVLTNSEISHVVSESIAEGSSQAVGELAGKVAKSLSNEAYSHASSNLSKEISKRVSAKFSGESAPHFCKGSLLGELINSNISATLSKEVSGVLPAFVSQTLSRNIAQSISSVVPSERLRNILQNRPPYNLLDTLPDKLQTFLNTNVFGIIGDRFPLTDLLALNITDLLPSVIVDVLNTINDFLKELQQGIKGKIIEKINDVVKKTLGTLGSYVSSGMEWVDKIQILNDIEDVFLNTVDEFVGAYIDNNLPDLLSALHIKSLQESLENILSVSFYNVLPENVKNIGEMTCLDILPENVNDIIATPFLDQVPEEISNFLKQDFSDFLSPKISKTLETNLINIVLPEGISDIMNKKVIDLFPGNVRGIIDVSPYNQLKNAIPWLTTTLSGYLSSSGSPNPSLGFSPFVNLLPDQSKNPLSFSSDPWLAHRDDKIIDLLAPNYKDILTKKLGDFSDDEINQLPSLLSKNIINLTGHSPVLEKNLLDNLNYQEKNLLTYRIRDLIESNVEEKTGIRRFFDAELKDALKADVPQLFQSPLQSLGAKNLLDKDILSTISSNTGGEETAKILDSAISLLKKYTFDNRPEILTNFIDLKDKKFFSLIDDDAKSFLETPLFNQLSPAIQDSCEISLWDTLSGAHQDQLNSSLLELLPTTTQEQFKEPLKNQVITPPGASINYKAAISLPIKSFILDSQIKTDLENKIIKPSFADKTILELTLGSGLNDLLDSRLSGIIPSLKMLDRDIPWLINNKMGGTPETTANKTFLTSKNIFDIAASNNPDFAGLLYYDFWSQEVPSNIRNLAESPLLNSLPPKLQTLLQTNIEDILNGFLPCFGSSAISWQTSLSASLGITDTKNEIIKPAVESSITAVSPKIKEETNRVFQTGGKAIAKGVSKTLLKNISKKTGQKLSESDGYNLSAQLSQKISDNIKEILEHNRTKGVPLKEKVDKGLMLNSLNNL